MFEFIDDRQEAKDTFVSRKGQPSGTLHFAGGQVAAGPAIEPAAAANDGRIGQRVHSFRLLKELGSGGMGTVYYAEHEVIGSRAAVKILHPTLAADADLVRRFFTEARAVNRIAHENVVKIFDLVRSDDGGYCLVMEYLDGRSLNELCGAPCPAEVALHILEQICDALAAVHDQGIIHRDLKPANIFLIKRGEDSHFVKLLDFGIAKLLSADAQHPGTLHGMWLGTPDYMAPEQFREGSVDARSDLYSVGIIAYQLATGRLPFTGKSPAEVLLAHVQRDAVPPSEVEPSVPRPLSELVMRLLAKDPGLRFQTAREVRDALTKLRRSLKAPGARALAPTPAPVDAAPARRVHARVVGNGIKAMRGECRDLSRASFYLCSEPPFPAAMSDVGVVLEFPEGELACTGRVVSHVSVEQAAQWKRPPGFGVQITDQSPSFRDALEKLMRGERPAPPVNLAPEGADNRALEPIVEEYRRKILGDHYRVLGLAHDVDFDHVRIAAREARKALDAARVQPMSSRQRAVIEAGIEHVHRALQVLGTPARRVEYDGQVRNFRGVARCLAAGLTVTELENARRNFFKEARPAEANAAVHAMSGEAHAKTQALQEAVNAYERALHADPLNLGYQQRYWALKNKLKQQPAPEPSDSQVSWLDAGCKRTI